MGRHSWMLWRQWEQIHGPRPCLQQVLALLAFVCPSLSARAVELGWTQEQLLAEMQIINAPQSYVHVTSSSNSSGPVDGPPALSATPTPSSSTPFPTLPVSSSEADPQVLKKESRSGENAGSSVTISGLAQPQVLSTATPTLQSNNISSSPTDGNAVNQPTSI